MNEQKSYQDSCLICKNKHHCPFKIRLTESLKNNQQNMQLIFGPKKKKWTGYFIDTKLLQKALTTTGFQLFVDNLLRTGEIKIPIELKHYLYRRFAKNCKDFIVAWSRS